MPELYYNKFNDEIVRSAFVNSHHLIFPRRDYYNQKKNQSKELLTSYRACGGFIIKMLLDIHKDLHSYIKPPIMPSNDLMLGVLYNQRTMDGLEPTERLNYTIDYLGALATDEALTLQDNLKQQQIFVEIGKVVLLPLVESNV